MCLNVFTLLILSLGNQTTALQTALLFRNYKTWSIWSCWRPRNHIFLRRQKNTRPLVGSNFSVLGDEPVTDVTATVTHALRGKPYNLCLRTTMNRWNFATVSQTTLSPCCHNTGCQTSPTSLSKLEWGWQSDFFFFLLCRQKAAIKTAIIRKN